MRLSLPDRQIECQAAIFDKDGTLVDLLGVDLNLARSRAEALTSVAGPEASAAWQRAVGVHVRTGWIDPDGPICLAPRRDEMLVAATVLYQLGHSWDEARALAQTAYDRADELLSPPFGSVLLPGIVEMLTTLQRLGARAAIATTDRRWRAEASMEALGIAHFFGAIVGVEDVANGKPAPDMVRLACQRLGCLAGDAIVVGDSPADLAMGRAAGVAACIGVTTGLNDAERLRPLADVVLASAASLPSLLAAGEHG